jgi:hypothetical protein
MSATIIQQRITLADPHRSGASARWHWPLGSDTVSITGEDCYLRFDERPYSVLEAIEIFRVLLAS